MNRVLFLVRTKDNLFTKEFAPKWMYNKVYTKDVHGASHGIITFSKSSIIYKDHIDIADKILNWTLKKPI